MSEETDKPAPESGGLFVGWAELNDLVAPRLGRDRFRALIKTKQATAGFPRLQEEWGGFYLPAVRAWLDSENGVGANVAVTSAEDGPETFDAAPRKKTGLQNRPARPAVLDRVAGHARSNGIPRHLRSVTTGQDR